ncbi:phage recombination protein Bet [Brevundimonas sp.]|uniref:phage recombination protein Bet n=1 Tax=Brevundimonas sp. TaxID=1871086 RepID=UPI0028B01477|nr:phage recombination protein Bet [Brevundimonas sp.]
MTNIAVLPTAALSSQQITLIRRTIANDCNDAEFDLFMAAARSAGLDPFRKQISPLVFNKNKPDKRRMSIITTIDGLRVIAARSGRYRPDENEPGLTYDPAEKSATNPLGLIKAVVKVYIDDKPVTGVAYWDEFAPISDEWGEDPATGRRKPTGKKTLDTGGNWGRMPRVMLAKCAEAQALRKAFPEDMSGLYEGAELDQARASDVLPSEAVATQDRDDRLARIGGANAILFQLFPNTPLENVVLGQVFDRLAERVSEIESLQLLDWFESANRAPLQEFWARAGGDALELKKLIERKRVELDRVPV